LLCLGIDTTGANCSAALVDEGRIHAYARREINRGHEQVLGPMVEELFNSASVTANDLSKISVCVGPGSFTGLRVGLSFAKGLALPWGIPVVGVSGLEAWARRADPAGETTVIACADVRRGELFWQEWVKGVAQSAPKLSGADTLRHTLGKDSLIAGSGAQVLGAPASDTFICPALIAWIGMTHNPKTHPADPLYHRPPDAKLPGGRSLAQASA